MQTIYLLSKELTDDPDQVRQTQELTLDRSRPQLGLKGSCGLFASTEWWEAISRGTIPTRTISGRILKVYVTGMERGLVPNTIDIGTDTGEEHVADIYVNSRKDRSEFRAGRWVEIVYALDDLKAGGALEIPIEVRLSD